MEKRICDLIIKFRWKIGDKYKEAKFVSPKTEIVSIDKLCKSLKWRRFKSFIKAQFELKESDFIEYDIKVIEPQNYIGIENCARWRNGSKENILIPEKYAKDTKGHHEFYLYKM